MKVFIFNFHFDLFRISTVLFHFLHFGSFKFALASLLRPADVLGTVLPSESHFQVCRLSFSGESAGMWGNWIKVVRKKNVLSLCSAAALVTELS